jgi:mono/diheme cytochrome c family protein
MTQQESTTTAARDRKRQTSSRRWLKQRNLIIGFVIMCMLALVVFAIRAGTRSATVYTDRADVANAQLVAQGEQVYATRCASCHGGDLKGEQGWPQRRPNGAMPAAPLDESGQAWQHDDQWLFTTIKQGGQATAAPGYTSYMPAFDGLTDANIWAVISYIKHSWPQHLQDAQPQSRG